jgi:subtilase family serine protease
MRFSAYALLSVALLVLASAATAGQTQLYAKGVRICKSRVKANHLTCFAMKRVFVKAGTPGAHPYYRTVLATTPNVATIGPNGGLTPGDLWAAYHVTTGATAGAGQTVAIVDAFNDPNIAADLATFSTQYGLAACTTGSGCLKIVNQSGAASPLPADDTTGWSAEETLDVETVHAICQGCKIVLVEANSTADSDFAAAENAAANTIHATEISNSFGGPEAANPTLQAAFNHPGIVITVSTGDDGYYSWDLLALGGTNVPNVPAAYNTVVAVGGTGLYLNQAGTTRANELVWNDNGPSAIYAQAFGQGLGAGGGGCSTLFSAQGWQTHVANWSGTGCGTKRLDADVSALADPLTGFDVYDSFTCASNCPTSPSWLTVGGTSLASPIVAAIYGLAGGAHSVSYPALTLYGHLSSAYDVTVGGNGWCDGEGAAQCTAGGTNPNLIGAGVTDCAWNAVGTAMPDDRACDAAPGYDGPSGVGAPNGMTMFTKTGPNFTISGGATATHNVTHHWLAASITDPFPGGSVSALTGCSWAWGDGSSNLNTTCTSTAHKYTSAGTKTITLTVKDNYGVTTAKTLKVVVS